MVRDLGVFGKSSKTGSRLDQSSSKGLWESCWGVRGLGFRV